MPRAMRVCSTPRCPELVADGGRCPECRAAADKIRGTATRRGYTSPGHQRFRRAVLMRDPICVECNIAASTVADHYPLSRRELVDAGLDPNSKERGRGLCKRCHDKSTARYQPGGWAASR